jgi:hypothetical protein
MIKTVVTALGKRTKTTGQTKRPVADRRSRWALVDGIMLTAERVVAR